MILNGLKTNEFVHEINDLFVSRLSNLLEFSIIALYLASIFHLPYVSLSWYVFRIIHILSSIFARLSYQTAIRSFYLNHMYLRNTVFDGFAFELLTFVYLLSLSLLFFYWTKNALERTEKRTINQNSCI